MLKKISRLKKNNMIKTSRLKRLVFAEWTQINPTDSETIQQLTDAMTYGNPVQINYEGSGWRTIQPYGWNTSKDGNVLLMCYKDTGEVRSYRMDRIEDIYIDMDSTGPAISNNPSMNYDDDLDLLTQNLNGGDNEFEVNIEDNYPDDMPPIPGDDVNNVEIENGIYDDELQILENPSTLMEQTDEINNVIDSPVIEQNINEETNEQQDLNNDNQNMETEMEGENQNDEN